jgi:transcriptional antiterminator Rof (Rho-off)
MPDLKNNNKFQVDISKQHDPSMPPELYVMRLLQVSLTLFSYGSPSQLCCPPLPAACSLAGLHRLPLFLHIRDGKRMHLELQGQAVAVPVQRLLPDRQQLQFVLEPAPIGERSPPVQVGLLESVHWNLVLSCTDDSRIVPNGNLGLLYTSDLRIGYTNGNLELSCTSELRLRMCSTWGMRILAEASLPLQDEQDEQGKFFMGPCLIFHASPCARRHLCYAMEARTPFTSPWTLPLFSSWPRTTGTSPS